MKKNSFFPWIKIAAAVAGIILVAVIAIFAVKYVLDTEPIISDYTVMYKCDYSSITGFSVDNGEKNSFSVIDDVWGSNEYPDETIGEDKILKFLMTFEKMIAAEANPKLAANAFSNPKSTATVYFSNGQRDTFIVGDKVKDNDEYYIKKTNNDKAYVISANKIKPLFYKLLDFKDTNVFTPIVDNTISVSVTNENGLIKIKKYNTKNPEKNSLLTSNWQLIYPQKSECNVGDVSKRLFDEMTLKTDGFYDNDKALYAEYGLDDPVCVVTYECTENIKNTVSFGKPIDDMTYVKINDDDYIYRVSSKYISALNMEHTDVLSFLENLDKAENVQYIIFTYDDKQYDIAASRENGKIAYTCDGAYITRDAFNDIYDEIVSINIDGEIELSGSGYFICSVSIIYDDPAANKTIDFYTYEDVHAAIIINGELNYYTSLEKVTQLAEKFEKLR